MKQFDNDFISSYIFGNSICRIWYKFEKTINKLIKQDLKSIKKNDEVCKAVNFSKKDWNVDKDKPAVIVKGKYETYWRVYFINYSYSYVVYSTPNGGTFIEELHSSYENINNIWQKDKWPSGDDYYINTNKLDIKIKSLQYIQNWLKENTESVEDENFKFVTRINKYETI